MNNCCIMSVQLALLSVLAACNSGTDGDRAGTAASDLPTAATHENFDYSSTLAAAEFYWAPRALDAWLAQPSRFLPGNRMTFAGVAQESDRRDLIAYLLTASSEPDASRAVGEK